MGLQRRVGDKGIGIESFHRFGGAAERFSRVARLAQDLTTALLGQFPCSFYSAAPAILGGLAFVPGHAKLAFGANSGPSGIRDNGNTGPELGKLPVALENKGVFHAGKRTDVVQIRPADAATGGRAFGIGGIEHVRYDLIDTKKRLSGDQLVIIDTGHPRAQQLVVCALLQGERFGVWNGKCRRPVGQFAIPQLPSAPAVNDRTFFRPALAGGNPPFLCSGCNKHGAGYGPGLAQLIPAGRNGSGAPAAWRPYTA